MQKTEANLKVKLQALKIINIKSKPVNNNVENSVNSQSDVQVTNSSLVNTKIMLEVNILSLFSFAQYKLSKFSHLLLKKNF
jgi:hypothetical protein